MIATLQFSELTLPWGRMWDLSVPGLDTKFQKEFRITLTAAGGADPTALLRLGIGTKANPKDRLQIYSIVLTPADAFSHQNVTIEQFLYNKNVQTDFRPAHKAQRTVDAAVLMDRMLAIDVYLDAETDLGIMFTNTSALGAAGYTGIITGRIYREVN